MAQYPRVPMPEPADPMRSLGELLQMARGIQGQDYARRDQEYQDKERARAETERRAVDTALGSQQPSGPNDEGVVTPAASREQILASLPGHLRPIVMKQFDEADENGRKAQSSILQLQEAHRKATTDVNEHLAGLGYSVAQFNYGPQATALAVQQARDTYKNDPEILKRIDAFDQQTQADPAQIKPLVNGMIGQSPRYAAMMEKQGNKSISDLANEATNSPDATVRADAQKTLDKMAEFERGKQRQPAVKSLQHENVLLDGKPAIVSYDPSDGSYLQDGQPIESRRVKPLPPQENPEVLADRQDRRQQATDLRLWTADRSVASRQYSVAMGEHARQLRAYAADAINATKDDSDPTKRPPPEAPEAPAAMTQSFEEWQAAHPHDGSTSATPAKGRSAATQALVDKVLPPNLRSQPSGAPARYRVGQTVTLKGGAPYVIKEVSPDGQSFR